jgi:uncharacterized membrane protein YjdF
MGPGFPVVWMNKLIAQDVGRLREPFAVCLLTHFFSGLRFWNLSAFSVARRICTTRAKQAILLIIQIVHVHRMVIRLAPAGFLVQHLEQKPWVCQAL